MPKLMKVLHEIPYDQVREKILGTALEAIGAFCEWFKENPAYLPAVIDLLLKGLNSSMASQATLGLKDLCRECQVQMRVYAEPLLQACQQSLVGGRLTNSECVRLMFSIGKIMSMLPSEKILPCLDLMISPCFEELQQIVQKQQPTEANKIRAQFRLRMISTLFSSLNTNAYDDVTTPPVTTPPAAASMAAAAQSPPPPPTKTEQPVLIVMQKTMPLFKSVGEMFINDPTTVEALCNALKQAITNLLNDFKPMLPDLCCLIIAIFQAKCVPPAIEIAKTVSAAEWVSFRLL